MQPLKADMEATVPGSFPPSSLFLQMGEGPSSLSQSSLSQCFFSSLLPLSLKSESFEVESES